MEKSESIKNIANALLTFADKVGKVMKGSTNPYFNSRYADLPTILDVIGAPLRESGLVITQHPDGDGLTTLLLHPASGEWMASTGVMHPVKSDPQAIGSAITYQRRYSIGSILCLNIDDDDDGNSASAPAHPQPQSQDGMPWLTSKQFDIARQRIEAGESGVTAKITDHFRVKKDYVTILQNLELNGKK
ncbi:MAG: ERF family protein [Bacteroidales bacterium]|jgi:hypothetical protein